jgi:hypothetical protein
MNALLKLKIFTLMTALALTGAAAQADTIQDIIDGGGSVQVGNLVFSDFSVEPMAFGSGISPDASEISFQLINNGAQAGIRFSGPWFAMGDGSMALSTIGFKVSVSAQAEAFYDIVGSTLNMPSHPTVGEGVVSVVENIHSSDPDIQANTIAYLENYHKPGNDVLETDTSTFGEYDELWVRKSIVVAGGGDYDIAQLGQVGQLFTTQEVPEPGTLGVMGIGALGMMLARKRRRTSRSR